MNQLFSPELIPDYMHAHPEYGVKRILTYTVYRFLSFAGKEDDTLAAYIKETLFPMEDALDFSLISDYLALDPYFCPIPEEDSFDAFFLYTAISILENAFDEFALGDELAIIDDLILTKYPVLGSVALDDSDIRLDALIGSGAEFYAVLYLALTRYPSALGSLLPQFGAAYHDSYQFTGDDTALYDFMDEYFETKNCMLQPFFVELSNTLVDATLGYYKTDLETLLATEVTGLLNGTVSRFAVQKRFGALGLTRLPDHDTCLALLSESFRYAALYELRSNLFDYHLEEDRLVTADNWKDTIRFHFVQYQHIYEQALDGFYAAVLSRKLLRAEFSEELKKLLPTAYAKMKLSSVTAAAFAVSLTIELTQLITKRGLFEFDDMFHNTLGAIIGYGVYQLIRTLHNITD